METVTVIKHFDIPDHISTGNRHNGNRFDISVWLEKCYNRRHSVDRDYGSGNSERIGYGSYQDRSVAYGESRYDNINIQGRD